MSVRSNYRIYPGVIQADREAHVALAALPDYQPNNAELSQANVLAVLNAMQAAHKEEILAEAALAAARDAAAAAERLFHRTMLAAKDQVIAQYGVDSDEVHSLGLKKKSEHKRRSRAVPAQPGQ